MRTSSTALLAFVLGAAASPLVAAPFTWTGELPTGWQGEVTPPNDGTADLTFGASLLPAVTLSSSLDDVNTINFVDGSTVAFTSASNITLTINGGIFPSDATSGAILFEPTINVGINGSFTFSGGNNQFVFEGQITGNGSVTYPDGAVLIFNNTGAGNTYTGNTFVGNGTIAPDFGIWNSSPFGTGTVNVLNGTQFAVHGTQTLSNPFIFNSAMGAANSILIKGWDAPVTFTGPITLANPVTLVPQTSTWFHLPNILNQGTVEEPGPLGNNPIVFSGSVGETGGSQSLTVDGTYILDGVLFLTGTSNTYSGGTNVNADLVFGSAASIPAAGSVTLGGSGYLGTADTSGGAFAALVGHVSPSSSGSFGIDTLPGQGTATYSGNIDLSGFTNSSVAIGTATSAILTGTITPQSTNAFQFGGGGGTLFVDTPLANIGSSTQLQVNSHGLQTPLTVYLQGNDTYLGPTSVNSALLIFDGPNAIPIGNQINAGGTSSAVGQSYVGYTDLVGISPATFLGHFTQSGTWGIIGFDSSNLASPVTINGVDLTGFNDGVFIGTATAATLTGTLTPSTVTNGAQTPNTLRLTAALSGTLTVDSTINDNGSPVSVVLGSPSGYGQFSSGTVVMNGANGYTGGTTINVTNFAGITVALGNNSALGAGPVTIAEGGLVGIQASVGGIVLPNSVTFQDTMSDASELFLTGTNNFTLSGNIDGDGTSSIILYNLSPITVTLSGDNSFFSGVFNVYNGTLKLPSNSAVGAGYFNFPNGANGTIDLTGAAAPVIQSLNGALGNLVLSSGSTLTIDTTNDASIGSSTFGGVISGSGASVVVSDTAGTSDAVVILYGNNTYSGGTTVTGYGELLAASNQALGTGTVTVATNSVGALALDTGVTLTNPLVFTSGNLAGDGTFNPSGLGLSGTVTVGAGQGIAGGLPLSHNSIVAGTLSFAGNLTFNNGGIYYWTLQDNSRPDGISQVDVAGNVVINATAGGFGLGLLSYDAAGNQDFAANFSTSVPASWVILTTGGTIQNFSPTDFTIVATSFENGTIPSSHFSLSLNGSSNQLILNFTPVPEPSTWALLILGLGAVASAAVLGKRRRPAALCSPG
jgi:hypothetical protein